MAWAYTRLSARDQLYFSATKQRPTKSFDKHVYNTLNIKQYLYHIYQCSTKLQLQRIKLHIEIVNLNTYKYNNTSNTSSSPGISIVHERASGQVA